MQARPNLSLIRQFIVDALSSKCAVETKERKLFVCCHLGGYEVPNDEESIDL
jgi:hypothetical protein